MSNSLLPSEAISNKREVRLCCLRQHTEKDDKLSLMGWFPDGVIDILDSKASPTEGGFSLSNLGLAVCFLDGEGEFKVRMSLTSPSGEKVEFPDDNEVTKKPGRFLTMNISLSPFTALSYGKFALSILLDDRKYSFAFTVRRTLTASP